MPVEQWDQGGYKPLSLYDAPSVLAAQLIEGEASFRNVRNTLLNDASLTPQERTDLADAIVGGGDGIMKATARVLTNPWIWAGFLVGPVGAKAITSGKGLWAVKNGSAKKHALGWGHWFRNPMEELAGSSYPTWAIEMHSALERKQLAAATRIAPAIENVKKMLQRQAPRPLKWAATPLDPNAYREGTIEHRLVSAFSQDAGIMEHQLYKNRLRPVREQRWELVRGDLKTNEGVIIPVDKDAPNDQSLQLQRMDAYNKHEATKGKNARYKYFVQGKTVHKNDVLEEALYDEDAFMASWNQWGPEADQYIKTMRDAKRIELVEYIGDEDFYAQTGQFKMDDRKIDGVINSLNREMTNVDPKSPLEALTEGATSLQGKEMLMSIIGVDKYHAMHLARKAPKRQNDLREAIKDAITPDAWEGATWASRNTFELVKVKSGGKWITPPGHGTRPEREAFDMAPYAASNNTKAKARIAPLTDNELSVSPEFLEDTVKRGHVLTKAGQKHLKRVQTSAQRHYEDGLQKHVVGLYPNPDLSHRRYVTNMHVGSFMDTSQATEAMLKADLDALQHVPDEARHLKTVWGAGTELEVGKPIPEAMKKHMTPGDILDRLYVQHANSKSPARQNYIRTFAVPSAISNAGPDWVSLVDERLASKELANAFAKGWIGKIIKNSGKYGREFIERVEDFGNYDKPFRGTGVGDGLAHWFYVSHLGLNMGSMVLNMMQPFVLAATIGTADEIVGAYADSIRQMGKYAELRLKSGKAFLTPAQKIDVMGQAFPFVKESGMGPHFMSVVDTSVSPGGQGVKGRIADVMMKGFEKTEWFNRTFSANLYNRVARRGGQQLPATFRADMERFVLQANYGQSQINTPKAFMQGPLRYPLMRQFFTFPFRTAVSAIDTFPKMGGGNYAEGLMRTTLRGMGMSALVYEMGKGLVGADLNKGLYATAVTDIVGGDKLVEDGQEILPLPPVIRVPLDFIRGVAGENSRLLANSIARTIPGGVAINRFLNMSPEIPSVPGTDWHLQATYVDWNSPLPSGEVPVYKGDGTLIEYRTPTMVSARALGIDLGQWGQQGELDNYLVKQRDEIIRYRHEFLRQLSANEVGRAQSVAREFQERFKIPLTVTEDQVSGFMQTRERGRTERVLDRLPPEVRYLYGQLARATGAAPNLPPGILEQDVRGQDREAVRQRGRNMVSEQELQRRVQQVGPAGQRTGNTFDVFPGY